MLLNQSIKFYIKMRKFLANVLRTFFVEESTFYSVYYQTKDGNRPLCQWFRGLNPPRVGEFIALEKDDTTYLPKPEKKFEYYKVIAISNIFYRTKHTKGKIICGKKEGVIMVKYVGNDDPTKM